MDYNYPIQENWTTEELVTVMELYSAVESAYENGVSRKVFMGAYRAFKEIVPSKSEEKTLLKEFEKGSGYIAYEVIKAAKNMEDDGILKVSK
ncbi:UPF0223 family protein [Sporosarcina sp. CAU 1771]